MSLKIVLADFEMPPLPIHVLYQGGRKAAARVRSFVDFTVKALREHPALQELMFISLGEIMDCVCWLFCCFGELVEDGRHRC